jgi:diketogulonate reductase-like aldo/keto reductase
MYNNEREVGEGLHASGIKRDEIFVTTKVWPTHFSPPELERAAKESVARMRLSHVDLLLLHWPSPKVPLVETLGALAKVKQAGLARHIGISNFTVAMVDEAVKLCTEPLVCNQIECHVYLDQSKVIGACRKHGLAITAHSPIASGDVARDKAVAAIGKAHDKTAAQVCLRYLIQLGLSVIPRTSKVERLSSNADIFDFTLSPDEMSELRALARPGGRRLDWSFSGSPQWD